MSAPSLHGHRLDNNTMCRNQGGTDTCSQRLVPQAGERIVTTLSLACSSKVTSQYIGGVLLEGISHGKTKYLLVINNADIAF